MLGQMIEKCSRNIHNTVRQFDFKLISEVIKNLLFKMYIYTSILIYLLFVNLLNFRKWNSFESLGIIIGYVVVIHLFLKYLFKNENLNFHLNNIFFHLKWLIKWATSHLIMVSVYISFTLFHISSASIFIIATFLILMIVHFIIKYLQDMKVVDNDNPFFVLWIGLISTFIGFTLSTYTQEAFNEKDQNNNLIGALDLAIVQADNINDTYNDQIRNILLKLKEKDKITLEDITIDSLPSNDALEEIIKNGELYNNLSPIAINDMGFLDMDLQVKKLNNAFGDSDSEQQKGFTEAFEQVKNKQSENDFKDFIKFYIDILYYVQINQKELIYIMENEKAFLSKTINQQEYLERVDEGREEFQQYSERLEKTTLTSYLESIQKHEYGVTYSDPVFVHFGEGKMSTKFDQLMFKVQFFFRKWGN
ncbi:hypothetical protein COE53_04325 [Bacillus sp. AFS029533]|nr:hypothetical protein COE53_04325 [Bacillus sp. AFS029533]